MRAEETLPNQSRPLRKSDGSDFFIARLWQIYQRALIFGKSCDAIFFTTSACYARGVTSDTSL